MRESDETGNGIWKNANALHDDKALERDMKRPEPTKRACLHFQVLRCLPRFNSYNTNKNKNAASFVTAKLFLLF